MSYHRLKSFSRHPSAVKAVLLASVLLGVATNASAASAPVEYKEGVVAYAGACETLYVFSYFDGSRVQQHCVDGRSTVPIGELVHLSRSTDCYGRLLVVHGRTDNGLLDAHVVEPVHGCGRGRNRITP